MANGMSRKASQTVLLGVMVKTGDEDLLGTIKNTYRGTQARGNSDRISFVIE